VVGLQLSELVSIGAVGIVGGGAANNRDRRAAGGTAGGHALADAATGAGSARGVVLGNAAAVAAAPHHVLIAGDAGVGVAAVHGGGGDVLLLLHHLNVGCGQVARVAVAHSDSVGVVTEAWGHGNIVGLQLLLVAGLGLILGVASGGRLSREDALVQGDGDTHFNRRFWIEDWLEGFLNKVQKL